MSTKTRLLLVEGDDDKRVIPELIEKNGVVWTQDNPLIPDIHSCGGYSKLLNQIKTRLKESSLSQLGVIIDADDNPLGRWESIKNRCQVSIPNLPNELSEDGLICEVTKDLKFGVWLMPDNFQRGMLETFLAYMIPNETETLWQFAQSSVQEAINRGAKLTEVQYDKANIYTWLAWQDPPGRQLHQAVKETVLDPHHPRAQKFVKWFKDLYEL
ncbi:hypothetical protein H6F42_10575 [Pseudanabaena sp. FACHB-1998]|uniref:DUF3226 domain-containing protein n=1 Tax=Pseudanabaena sp. FACHB-1998 TaxID=2692858 RepID=UPI0016807D6A|nr:DUF3226 domain-containing protein [Pseudanabaena sp. FACHB-1998]MBD2177355.1 hypothetical protein [Pseudanabaena sp. FACHB-1998]